MKKFKFFFLSLTVLFLGLQSCEIDDDGPFRECVEGEGPAETKQLYMPEFSGIDLDIDAEVFITQGEEFKVEARGERNIMDLLELDVQNDTWKVEFEECVRDYNLKLFITMPKVRILKISGSGEIQSENLITGDDLILDVNGSGDMILDVAMEDEIDGEVDGSGKVWLTGNAQKLDWKIDGSGDLEAFDLEVRKADIEIKGSGNASITVTDLLEATIDGSGNVFFKGDPLLDIDIKGSGDVVDAN